MSPRRIELLGSLGLKFQSIPSHVDESFDPSLKPEEIVVSLAERKAGFVFDQLSKRKDLLVIGADTIVYIDNKVLNKPESKEEAEAMLDSLSGRCHQVFTGVAILQSEKPKRTFFDISSVFFRQLSEKEIRAYVQTGEPMDKAGAYALQGIGSALVEKIDGCFTNVIGLPLPKLVVELRMAGLDVLGDIDESDA